MKHWRILNRGMTLSDNNLSIYLAEKRLQRGKDQNKDLFFGKRPNTDDENSGEDSDKKSNQNIFWR